MYEETYTKRIKCNNCGHAQALDIQKGITVVNALAQQECHHCGCKEFREDTSQPEMSM